MIVCSLGKRQIRVAFWLIFIFAALWGEGIGHSMAKSSFEKITEIKSISTRGVDPYFYATARQMYTVAPSLEMDAHGQKLMAEFEQAMKSGMMWNTQSTIERLKALEPYRMSGVLRNKIISNSQKAFRRSSQRETIPSALEKLFQEANRYYMKGDFQKAADQYLKLLEISPKDKYARNNFALSHMHMGNDLIAWANLHLLTQQYKDYVPGWVNLTVVLERLGNSDMARNASESAMQVKSDVVSSQALFNQAWFAAIDGNMYRAKKILDPLNQMSHSSTLPNKYRSLATALPPPKFWQKGLAGVSGGTKAWWTYLISCTIFLVLYLVISIIMANFEFSSLVALVVSFSYYIIFWGLPESVMEWGWAIALSIGYSLIYL